MVVLSFYFAFYGNKSIGALINVRAGPLINSEKNQIAAPSLFFCQSEAFLCFVEMLMMEIKFLALNTSSFIWLTIFLRFYCISHVMWSTYQWDLKMRGYERSSAAAFYLFLTGTGNFNMNPEFFGCALKVKRAMMNKVSTAPAPLLPTMIMISTDIRLIERHKGTIRFLIILFVGRYFDSRSRGSYRVHILSPEFVFRVCIITEGRFIENVPMLIDFSFSR